MRKIYDYLYRISVEPDTAAQMDLPNFVSQLDRTHLLDFATGISFKLTDCIDNISPKVIRDHYLPCMAVTVKRMAEEEIFKQMAMGRDLLVNRYLSQYLPDESVGSMLYDFCQLAYHMGNYILYKEEATVAGFKITVIIICIISNIRCMATIPICRISTLGRRNCL